MLIGMALIPAVSAQKEDNYSVTAEKAFEHANAQMISFIATDTDFEKWEGASIDPKPLELYDIIRVCRGYSDSGVGVHYLKINDPLPVGSGHQYIET